MPFHFFAKMSLPQTGYFSISNFLYKLTQPSVQYTVQWSVYTHVLLLCTPEYAPPPIWVYKVLASLSVSSVGLPSSPPVGRFHTLPLLRGCLGPSVKMKVLPAIVWLWYAWLLLSPIVPVSWIFLNIKASKWMLRITDFLVSGYFIFGSRGR